MDFKDRDEMGELEEFEEKLRRAMGHRAAPVGLKQRVLAKARERRNAQRGRWWLWQRVAVSAALAAVVGGAAVYRQVQERRKGEEAREQVMLALRITSKTLDRVNARLADGQ